jgi:uncharacterized phage-associated protein
MHSAKQVANKLLELAKADGVALTPMQLMKLVYLCHGWMLGLYGRPLITDRIEAWTYGPVIPELYRLIKKYKSQPITEPLDCDPAKFDEKELDLVTQVYKKYGRKSGIALSQLTHQPASPWSKVWSLGSRNESIPSDLIEDYFAKLG